MMNQEIYTKQRGLKFKEQSKKQQKDMRLIMFQCLFFKQKCGHNNISMVDLNYHAWLIDHNF
jgi:hypothetical protein